MAGNSTISVTFKLDGDSKSFRDLAKDADGLKRVFESTLKEAEGLKTSLINWSQATQAIQATNTAIASLNNAFQTVVSSGQSFDKAMRQTNTMAGKGAEDFEKMKASVSELAKTIPLAREELANGLYQVISNGVPEDNWIAFLEQSAKSAVGGIADLGQTVTVTSTLIKNYGLDWEEALAIQDKIQMTAKNGVTSFEQLAAALPRVSGTAASLGVSIEELMAVFATTTGVTGNTAEVATQLGAVLKALVKPSTEAAKAAEAMGLQFDAAAIRAAGGFDTYLKSLDETVKAYAQRTGQLSETLYGQLFGSAEALRILTSLTGEQADKFTQNIEAMADSAGTIDGAFGEMTKTGEATTQMIKNQIASMTDLFSSVAGGVAPYASLIASLAMTAGNAAALSKAVKAATVAIGGLTTKAKVTQATMKLLGVTESRTAAITRVMSSAMKGAAYQTTALKIAMKGLMAATGVGLAITALITLIEKLSGRSQEAEEKVDILADSVEEFKTAAANAKVAMDREISSLKALMDSNGDTAAAVKRLNEEYGDIFGTHKTASDWYDTLVKKSKIYCKQLGYEAQARSLAQKIAELEIQKEMNEGRMGEMKAAGQDKTMTTRAVGGGNSGYVQNVSYEIENPEFTALREQTAGLTADLAKLQEQFDKATDKMEENAALLAQVGDGASEVVRELDIMGMSYQEVADAITANEKALKGLKPTQETERKALVAQNRQLESRKSYLEKILGLEKKSGKTTSVATPSTYEELSKNIEAYKKKMTSASTEEQAGLRRQIALWEEQKRAIELTLKEAERPLSLKTFADIEKELSFQRARRQVASAENLAEIDAEIKRLEDLRSAFERNSHVPLPIDKVKTYKELNEELAYYNRLLEVATEEERSGIQAQINALNKLRESWDQVLEAMNKPGEVSTLNTIEDLDKALSYYQNLQKKQTEEEIANTQRVIQVLEAKRAALERGIRIPSMQKEMASLGSLKGKALKVELQAIGFDGFKAKIKELQDMLRDFDHPVSAAQKKDIEGLIETYRKYQKQLANSFDTYKEGWNAIRGMGDAITNITKALEGEGTAWEKVSAVVDGFISLYESLKAVIGIIDFLTAATSAHSAAKGAEAAAVTAEAQAEVAAGSQKIATNTALIASQMGLATANTAAAGSGAASAVASIPYVGPIMAVAALASVIAAIMAIPKFAEGGIAYGPTLGLFGEYAGASNNPEVVAPLDKLKGLISPGEGFSGHVDFKIKGRDLVGVVRRVLYEELRNGGSGSITRKGGVKRFDD